MWFKNNIVTVPHTEGILSSPRSWTHLRLFSFCPCIVCSFLLLNVTSLGLRNYLGWGLCFKAFLCVCPWFAVLYYSVGSYLVRLPQTTLKWASSCNEHVFYNHGVCPGVFVTFPDTLNVISDCKLLPSVFFIVSLSLCVLPTEEKMSSLVHCSCCKVLTALQYLWCNQLGSNIASFLPVSIRCCHAS